MSSNALRTSSDLSRIKVRRANPATGQNQEWIIDHSNLQKYDGRNDLIVRDGDVIEIPDKRE